MNVVNIIVLIFCFCFAEHPQVVSVFPNRGRKLQTTRSWNFLGLENDGVIHPSSLWKKARFGEDTIIGNLDTGNIFLFTILYSIYRFQFFVLSQIQTSGPFHV